MIDKIINMFGSFVRLFAKAFLCIVISVLLYASVRVFWPFMYKRKIYDLGDKYLSCEWVSYSDTCRMVIVSKDGSHRAIVKKTLRKGYMDIYFQKFGTDTVFFPGYKGKESQLKIIEAADVVLEYSTGEQLIWDKDLRDFRRDYGGFKHLFIGKDLRSLNGRYVRVVVDTGIEFENAYSDCQPERVIWIWPLHNPLIRKYPFSKESRKSRTLR